MKIVPKMSQISPVRFPEGRNSWIKLFLILAFCYGACIAEKDVTSEDVKSKDEVRLVVLRN